MLNPIYPYLKYSDYVVTHNISLNHEYTNVGSLLRTDCEVKFAGGSRAIGFRLVQERRGTEPSRGEGVGQAWPFLSAHRPTSVQVSRCVILI